MSENYVSTSTLSNNIKEVLDKRMRFAFQPRTVFANLADTGVVNKDMGDGRLGSPVDFTIYSLMNLATAELNETSDPDSVAISNNVIQITPKEQGNVVTTTKKLQLTSFDDVKNSTLPVLVGVNMAESVDVIARAKLDAVTDARYNTIIGQTAISSLTTSNKVTAPIIREIATKLEQGNVPTDAMGYYFFIAHPNVINDLRAETGTGGWLDVAKYADPASAIRGEVGIFDRFRFIASNLVKFLPTGGTKALSTTVNGAQTAGDTTVLLTSVTGLSVGNILTITSGGSSYSYPVLAINTLTVTIGACFNKDGNVYRTDSDGLVVDAADADAAVSGAPVFYSYAMGKEALGFAYSELPHMTITGPFDKFGRKVNVGWYGMFNFGILRAAAQHKIASSSAVSLLGVQA